MAVELSTWDAQGTPTTPTFSTMRFPAGEAHVKVVDDADAGRPRDRDPARHQRRRPPHARHVGGRPSGSAGHGPWPSSRTSPARGQDRGLPFGAKVYADVLNGFHIDQVIAFDPHSPVIVGLVDRLTVVPSEQVVHDAVLAGSDYSGIIAPDKGAVARASLVADTAGLPLFRAEKHRNPDTGKLDGFSCEPLPETGRLLVVDDICDGGGTFMGLAGSTGLPKERLGLWVSHGVFSGRAPQLADHFGEIVTTDSYPAQQDVPGLRTVPLSPYLTKEIR